VASILPPFCGSQAAPKRTSEAKRKWDYLLPTPEFQPRFIESAKEVDVCIPSVRRYCFGATGRC
jgi:hypothetical protein